MFLLDTSIILDDINNLALINGDIFISSVTLHELDSKKELNNQIGYFAREFFRRLNYINESANISPINSDKIHVFYFDYENKQIKIQIINRETFATNNLSYGLNDARILEIAKDYKLELLTNDISLKIQALGSGVSANPLSNNNTESLHDLNFFHSFKMHKDNTKEHIEKDNNFCYLKNWSLIEIKEQDNTESSLYDTGKIRYGLKINNEFCEIDFDLISKEKLYINPINLEQRFLYSLLTHKNNKITICSGATGSGKTIMALQAGISLFKQGIVDGIVYMRNTITANDKEAELGFRKGDEHQKLSYFMYPLFSAINFMITKMQKESLAKKIEYRGEANSIFSKEATEYFLQKHNIEVLDIAHARGISITKKFVIFDESQNASNATIKLIGTRMAEDSRIVFLGDINQIDHPYLNKYHNGLTTLLQKAKCDNFIAGIVLKHTIRSEIAGWFEDNL